MMKANLKNAYRWLAVILLCGTGVAVTSLRPAVAQNEINPRALEDLNAFNERAEQGDTLFHEKKYAEAATAFKEANEFFIRAAKRDANAERASLTIPPGAWPALRYYGYGMGQNPLLQENAGGTIIGTIADFNNTIVQMWMDAAILSDAEKVPLGSTFEGAPTLVDLTQDQLDSLIRQIYGPPARFSLPVQDHEWRNVLLWSRRAKLILEHALQKYPAWKTEQLNWGSGAKVVVTGDEALADVTAKIAEAEPEVERLTTDLQKAEPPAFSTVMENELQTLDGVLADVKRDGYIPWSWMLSLYIEKNYLSDRRKMFVKMYADQGKTMPADKLKPLENKVASVKALIEQSAPRWSFPAGKPHNAAIEAQFKSSLKNLIPGVTIYKTALATEGWSIVKDSAQMPMYRQRAVMALIKKPGEKWAWLIMAGYAQDYAGGGTYNSTGTIAVPYISARVQNPR